MVISLWFQVLWITSSLCSMDSPASPSPGTPLDMSSSSSPSQSEVSTSDTDSITPTTSIASTSTSTEIADIEDGGVLISDLFDKYSPSSKYKGIQSELDTPKPRSTSSHGVRGSPKKPRPRHPPPSPPKTTASTSESNSDSRQNSKLLAHPPLRGIKKWERRLASIFVDPKSTESSEFTKLEPSISTEQLASVLPSTSTGIRDSTSNSASTSMRSSRSTTISSRSSPSKSSSSRRGSMSKPSVSIRSHKHPKYRLYQSPVLSYSTKYPSSSSSSPNYSPSTTTSNPSTPMDSLILPSASQNVGNKSSQSLSTRSTFRNTGFGTEDTILETDSEPPEDIGFIRQSAIDDERTPSHVMGHESDLLKPFGRVERKGLPNTVEEVDTSMDLSLSLHPSVDPLLDTLGIGGGDHRLQSIRETISSDLRDALGKRVEFGSIRIREDFEQSESPIIEILAERTPYFQALLLHYADLTSLCTNFPPHCSRASSSLPFCPMDGISVFVPKERELSEYRDLTLDQMKWILLYHFVSQIIDVKAFDSSGRFTFETLLSKAALARSTEYSPQIRLKVLLNRPQRILVDLAPIQRSMNLNLVSRMSIGLGDHSARLTRPPIICSNGVVFFIDSVLTIPQSISQSIFENYSVRAQLELASKTVRIFSDTGITVFAISHSVWNAFVRGLASSCSTRRMVQYLLCSSLYHILPQHLYSDSFSPDLEVSSLLPGGRVRFQYAPLKGHQWYVNGCAILGFELFDGGVIYFIEGMMHLDDGKEGKASSEGSSTVSHTSGTSSGPSSSNSDQPSPRGLQAKTLAMSTKDSGVRSVRRGRGKCNCCHCIIL